MSLFRSSLLAGALALALSACGGGNSPGSLPGNNGGSGNNGGGGNGTSGASISISPSTLTFGGPGSSPQTFVLSSSITANAPNLNAAGCGSVATISGGGSALPATYTVTPTAVGSCTIVATAGTTSASLGINVGTSGSTISGPSSGLTFTLGGAPQQFTVTFSGGNASLQADATSCNGIATVQPQAVNGGPVTYNVTPVGVGTCQVTVSYGSASFVELITVNAASGTPSNAVIVTPSTLSFASRSAGPQSVAISFTGSVGQVTINEDACIGGPDVERTGPHIAYLTLTGTASGTAVSLPQTATVTPYGPNFASGTCTITFTPQTGAAATLTVSVSP